MRFALLCLIALTGAAPATTPAITAQDLIDVSEGAIDPETLTASMPNADRVRVIHKLLRAGGSCKRVTTGDACDYSVDYEAPRAKDTAKSPCFRRWHLYTLLFAFPIDEVIHLDAKEMRAVAKLDDELIGYLGPLLDPQQQVELAHLIVDQKHKLPFDLQLDHALAVKAVKQYHLDEAVEFIDPEQTPHLLVGIVLDPTYRAAIRTETLARLDDSGSVDHEWLVHIIRPLLRDPSLEVAAFVAAQTGIELRRPQTTDPAILMRALAIYAESANHDGDTAISYAPRGLDIISPGGEKVEHIGPITPNDPKADSWQLGEDLEAAFTYRLRFQPPIFGTDARGYVILVGFVDVPEPPASMDACELEMDGF